MATVAESRAVRPLPLRWRQGYAGELWAEFFGTFWLVFGGCGAAVLAAGFPNLGIACSRCNQTKGSRIDPRYPSDPRAVERKAEPLAGDRAERALYSGSSKFEDCGGKIWIAYILSDDKEVA